MGSGGESSALRKRPAANSSGTATGTILREPDQDRLANLHPAGSVSHQLSAHLVRALGASATPGEFLRPGGADGG